MKSYTNLAGECTGITYTAQLCLYMEYEMIWKVIYNNFFKVIFIEFEQNAQISLKKKYFGDFPGGPVTETPQPQCRSPGQISAQGTRSHMLQLRPGTAKETNKYFFKKLLCTGIGNTLVKAMVFPVVTYGCES